LHHVNGTQAGGGGAQRGHEDTHLEHGAAASPHGRMLQDAHPFAADPRNRRRPAPFESLDHQPNVAHVAPTGPQRRLHPRVSSIRQTEPGGHLVGAQHGQPAADGQAVSRAASSRELAVPLSRIVELVAKRRGDGRPVAAVSATFYPVAVVVVAGWETPLPHSVGQTAAVQQQAGGDLRLPPGREAALTAPPWRPPRRGRQLHEAHNAQLGLAEPALPASSVSWQSDRPPCRSRSTLADMLGTARLRMAYLYAHCWLTNLLATSSSRVSAVSGSRKPPQPPRRRWCTWPERPAQSAAFACTDPAAGPAGPPAQPAGSAGSGDKAETRSSRRDFNSLGRAGCGCPPPGVRGGPDDEPIHNGTLTVIRKIVPIYTWGFLLLVCFLFIMLLFAFLYMEQLLCFGYCKGRTCCDTPNLAPQSWTSVSKIYAHW
uniref:Ion_trans domain-containing protein n=1 Tax=Macrostomum lignano TaxID=282301 RepID=A0A1I8FR45_9PLAT